jgi:hexosaminidase
MEMVKQVIEMHTLSQQQQDNLLHNINNHNNFRTIPKMTHIHIGCDEVFQLGECSRCRAKVRDQLFLDHVYAVTAQIRKQWPHMKIIIWDDMLRHISLEILQNSGLGKIVEPMVWAYSEDIYKFIQSQTWDKYSQVFRTAWAAGAYKGAFGETMMVPIGRRHLENTLRWLAIIQGEGSR